MDLYQLKYRIIKPTLQNANLYSDTAVNLVLGTFIAESNCELIEQVINYNPMVFGPALGFGQMEPFTHDDCWNNFLKYKPDLADLIKGLCNIIKQDSNLLKTNINYMVLMTRIKYLRAKQTLPKANDALALATYHKVNYNSLLGKADISANIPKFQKAIGV